MSQRPIYRWKSFWLGMVVLCFLGWAWARSMKRMDAVRWRYVEGASYSDGRSIAVDQMLGRVSISWWCDPFLEMGVSYRSESLEQRGVTVFGEGYEAYVLMVEP